ncbi:HD domain-containing protein [Bacteriovoracaceae bacterium]|nr:HD domain-containing protein [Bacteriovoracaceae bacterium]
MVKNLTSDSFFSVSFDLILIDQKLPYDLFINSSTHETREKFVKIFANGNSMSADDLVSFKKKYYQLYVLESQRDEYLKSLVHNEDAGDIQKADVIKDSAIVYLDRIFSEEKEFTNEVLEETIQGCRDSVESMVNVIKGYDVSEVQELIANLSFHDFYTYDHSINVSMYSISIFQALKPNASKKELIIAGMGGLLHDLGKVKIPTRIINNPGKLNEDDFSVIKKHPEYGHELMESHCCSGDGEVDFEVIKRVILEHHENYNGTGYPNGLHGDDIHVYARITAIADFYDAITTKRSYHEVLATEDAIQVMSRSVGRKIDPKIFEVFTQNVSNILLKGKVNQELPDDFDPCQPQNVLPLRKPKAKVQRDDFLKKDADDFGKVKVNEPKKKPA